MRGLTKLRHGIKTRSNEVTYSRQNQTSMTAGSLWIFVETQEEAVRFRRVAASGKTKSSIGLIAAERARCATPQRIELLDRKELGGGRAAQNVCPWRHKVAMSQQIRMDMVADHYTDYCFLKNDGRLDRGPARA